MIACYPDSRHFFSKSGDACREAGLITIKTRPMNRNFFENSKRSRFDKHSEGFASVHPPGGFVAWPDGRTSRIGQRQLGHAIAMSATKKQKAFVAWPEKQAFLARA